MLSRDHVRGAPLDGSATASPGTTVIFWVAPRPAQGLAHDLPCFAIHGQAQHGFLDPYLDLDRFRPRPAFQRPAASSEAAVLCPWSSSAAVTTSRSLPRSDLFRLVLREIVLREAGGCRLSLGLPSGPVLQLAQPRSLFRLFGAQLALTIQFRTEKAPAPWA